MDEEKCPLSFHQPLTENRHFFQSRMLTTHSNVIRAGYLSTETTDPSISPLLQSSGNITYTYKQIQNCNSCNIYYIYNSYIQLLGLISQSIDKQALIFQYRKFQKHLIAVSEKNWFPL